MHRNITISHAHTRTREKRTRSILAVTNSDGRRRAPKHSELRECESAISQNVASFLLRFWQRRKKKKNSAFPIPFQGECRLRGSSRGKKKKTRKDSLKKTGTSQKSQIHRKRKGAYPAPSGESSCLRFNAVRSMRYTHLYALFSECSGTPYLPPGHVRSAMNCNKTRERGGRLLQRSAPMRHTEYCLLRGH